MIRENNFLQYVFYQERAEHPEENEALFNESFGLFWGDHPLYLQLLKQRGTHLVWGAVGSGKTAFARALGDYMCGQDVFAGYLSGCPEEKRVKQLLAQRLLEFVCENPYRMNMSRAERFLLAEVLSSKLDWREALARVEMALRKEEDPVKGTGPLRSAGPVPGERQFAVFFKQALEDVGRKPRHIAEDRWLPACLESVMALRLDHTRLVFDLQFPGSRQWMSDHFAQLCAWTEYGIDVIAFMPFNPADVISEVDCNTFPVSRIDWETSASDPLFDMVAWRYKQTAATAKTTIQDINTNDKVMEPLTGWLKSPERSPRQIALCWKQALNTAR